MKNGWVKRNKWIFFVAPLALVAFVAIFGEVVMHLWNWLLPPLFGWHQTHLLADSRVAGPLPDPLWKLDGAWLGPLAWPAGKARKLGADDFRGAGEVPRTDAEPVWRIRCACGRKQRAGLIAEGGHHLHFAGGMQGWVLHVSGGSLEHKRSRDVRRDGVRALTGWVGLLSDCFPRSQHRDLGHPARRVDQKCRTGEKGFLLSHSSVVMKGTTGMKT